MSERILYRGFFEPFDPPKKWHNLEYQDIDNALMLISDSLPMPEWQDLQEIHLPVKDWWEFSSWALSQSAAALTYPTAGDTRPHVKYNRFMFLLADDLSDNQIRLILNSK